MDCIVTRAKKFAKRKHASQVRKYTGEPYFVHCEEVAGILADHGFRPEVVAAAYLHDTLEDTDTTLQELLAEFGPDVLSLVMQVTDVSLPGDGNRKVRKALDRDHLAAASAEGQSIKLADLISNSRSIAEHDPSFAKVYLEEKRELLQVMTRGDRRLWEQAVRQTQDTEAV